MDEDEGRKKINWLALRTYVISGHTRAEAAKKFGVSRQAISQRALKEDWPAKQFEQLTAASKMLDEFDRVNKGEVLLNHASLADELVAAARAGLKTLLEDKEIKPRNRAETLKTYAEAADKAIRLSRDVRGLRIGDASDGRDLGDETLTIEEQIIEPMKIAVNGDGRAIL